MYQQHVLDHAKHPRHWQRLAPADAQAEVANPLCADKLVCTVRFDGQRVADVGFQGEGCAISRAGASLVAEHVIGKTRPEVVDLGVHEVTNLFGVPVTPARLKCATLGLEALQQALTKTNT